MSTFYDEMIEVALELIEEFGEPSTWRQVEDAVAPDPSKPWDVDPAVTTDYNEDIVFFPVDKEQRKVIQARTGTLIPEGTLIGYMASVSFTPSIKDVVFRENSQELAVKNIDIYDPGGSSILYIVEFEK